MLDLLDPSDPLVDMHQLATILLASAGISPANNQPGELEGDQYGIEAFGIHVDKGIWIVNNGVEHWLHVERGGRT